EARAQENLDEFFTQTDQFLKKYVAEGKVKYPEIVNKPEELNSLTRYIAQAPVKDFSGRALKAFYINAYNLLVISSVVEAYPTSSPQNVGGFFDGNKQMVGGEKLTLNEIEKKKLLAPTQDARLHFVLVCAALGCPPISPQAYRPERLEAQLETQTRLALNSDYFIRVNPEDKKVEISEIFNWYKSDFLKSQPNALAFINAYRETKIPEDYKVDFYTYDWALNVLAEKVQESKSAMPERFGSNLQVFTPSALFRKGQFEINFFNNLYTQTEVRDASGDAVNLSQRQTFINTMLQFTYGVSKSARVNVGFDVFLNSASVDNSGGSAFNHFFGDVDFRETTISYIAPRVKFIPFKKFPRVSVQTSFIIPVAQDLENRNGRFVAHDRYTFLTQFFSDFNLGPKWQVFIEEAIFYRIRRNSEQQNNFVRFFLSGFLSYFPTSKTTVFGFAQYAPRYERLDNGFDSQFGLSQWFTQVGIGGKYQVSPKLGLELSYGNFIASRNDGAGAVLNFGIRFIK
ncbi:MAG: DUF547 domain-containing protein, partial [Bacteroidota bacterium]